VCSTSGRATAQGSLQSDEANVSREGARRRVEPYVRPVATASARVQILKGGLPLSLDPHNRRAASYLRTGGNRAMTDIFPATLMLAAALAIWAGIAWLLIERIG
jgi:hypothetical protein